MFLIITRDTMFFTAMKNILSKGNVVHIQNEEEIDVMLHQNAFVIIDTLMNNVFHSNFLTQIPKVIEYCKKNPQKNLYTFKNQASNDLPN
jgi:LuxR family transcriptional regulator, dicarboxylate transport regulator